MQDLLACVISASAKPNNSHVRKEERKGKRLLTYHISPSVNILGNNGA